MDTTSRITLSVPRTDENETEIWETLSDWNKAASLFNLILVHRENKPRFTEDKISIDLFVESTHPSQFGMFIESDFETFKTVLFSNLQDLTRKFCDTKQSTKKKILSFRKNISKKSSELILNNNEQKTVPKDERAPPSLIGQESNVKITGSLSEIDLHSGVIKTKQSKINHKDMSSITSTNLKLPARIREEIEFIVANNKIAIDALINTYQAEEEQIINTYEIIKTDLHKVISRIAEALEEIALEDVEKIHDSQPGTLNFIEN